VKQILSKLMKLWDELCELDSRTAMRSNELPTRK
jgi:hypothetical protein